MRDELLRRYQDELTFLRDMSKQFAEDYPKIASRLLLERGTSQDPHVERLIESVALLTARVHLKIDDEFPEITQSLLQVLYPHYLCPVPSMTIVEFSIDPDQGKLSTGYPIERNKTLNPRQDPDCHFRTCYPVTLWPIEVQSARIEAGGPADAVLGRVPAGVLVLRLKTQGDTLFADMEIDRLRFYLGGETQTAHRLYELLFAHCFRVEVRDPVRGGSAIALAEPALNEVGFGKDEGLLPYPPRSFVGYRLIQEYFHFPEKFLFLDVVNLGPLRSARFEREAEIRFLLDYLPRGGQRVDAENFRLGCAPAINLFSKSAESFRIDHSRTEYKIEPDIRRRNAIEVYSVDEVTSISPQTGDSKEYQPFYSFKHSFDRDKQETFYHTTRRPSERKDDKGTEVYISLVNLAFRPSEPANDVLTLRLTCTSRDVPGGFRIGDQDGDFTIEGAPPVRRVMCLTKPTMTIRPVLGRRAQWRLISHLSLNYLSPAEWGGGESPDVLREILTLYDFSESPVIQQQISGLVGVSSRHVTRRIRSSSGSGFARGIEATLEFDEDHYVGTGVYLFAAVLERFLALYVSINSFSELVATTTQRGTLKRWTPRAGHQIPALRRVAGLDDSLFREGFRFEFFQAVRLLERIYPAKTPIGRDGPPDEEVVRFKTFVSMAFPASEVYDVATTSKRPSGKEAPPTMLVTFMGLAGALGVLPPHYTHLLSIPANKHLTAPLRDFLDIFNHRLISLFYRAWEKYRFPVAYERRDEDVFSQYLFCLIGLGTPGLQRRVRVVQPGEQPRAGISDEILLYYAGHLSKRPRSAVALEGLLQDYFGVPVSVEQFTGEWFLMNVDALTSLGARGFNNQLGVNAALWERIWDPQARFRVRLGPLTYKQFQDFMPTSDAYRHLVELTRIFVGEEFSFEVQPVLRADQIPKARLDEAPDEKPSMRLGWGMWLKTEPLTLDASVPIFAARVAHRSEEPAA